VSATRIAVLLALVGAACDKRDGASATTAAGSSGPAAGTSAIFTGASSGDPASAPAVSAVAPPAAIAPTPSGAEAPEPVGGAWVTCYAHFRPASTATRDVVRLGRLCGPATGMKLLGAVIEGEANQGYSETRVAATAGECLRIFAVAEAAVPDLMVEVRDARGTVVASDHNNDRWPIVNPDGPFCVTSETELTIRVHARRSRGKFAMQVWRLP
jgi:hypothetical protein